MRSLGLPTIAALAVAIVAVSLSAPLIAYAAAPALAIAFWRNALAVAVLTPLAAGWRRAELATLRSPGGGRRTALVCVFAGLALAVHFGTWVPSAKLTSVATATALVSTTPMWTALIAAVRGVRVARPTWFGIGVSVVGAALATGADVTISGAAMAGDLLALAGALAAAVYATYGERARASLSTTVYTTICYGVCAGALLLCCVATGTRLVGFGGRTWLAIAVMAAGPQLAGHSLLNYALHRVSATTIAVLLLLEVPGAALFGWLLLGQLPAARSVPGLVLVVLGVAVVLFGAPRGKRRGVIIGANQADNL
jgi:drug/metabolite transporter (DMT)-like permease